jgi:hypothetical protein
MHHSVQTYKGTSISRATSFWLLLLLLRPAAAAVISQKYLQMNRNRNGLTQASCSADVGVRSSSQLTTSQADSTGMFSL